MGEVFKASLKADEVGLCVDFMYNPAEFSISKTNTWNKEGKKGHNVPFPEFAGGEPRQLQAGALLRLVPAA